MERLDGDRRRRKKKVERTARPFTTALLMLRAVELGIGRDMLDLLTVGDVLDMLTEKANDSYEWPVEATESDLQAIFG